MHYMHRSHRLAFPGFHLENFVRGGRWAWHPHVQHIVFLLSLSTIIFSSFSNTPNDSLRLHISLSFPPSLPPPPSLSPSLSLSLSPPLPPSEAFFFGVEAVVFGGGGKLPPFPSPLTPDETLLPIYLRIFASHSYRALTIGRGKRKLRRGDIQQAQEVGYSCHKS